MPEPDPRRAGLWVALLYLVLILAGFTVTVIGVLLLVTQQEYGLILLGMGAVSMIVTMAMYPIATALQRSPAAVAGSDPRVVELLQTINERLLISDTAKRLAFRDKDRSALREAIRTDISKGDFEAALVLVDQMSRLYGYREEAEEFRSHILAARAADVQKKVDAAVRDLDKLIEQVKWPDAVREATKIQRLYPEFEIVRGLMQRVRDAREAHKSELIKEFHDAHARDDAERSWEVLKELDDYLTEGEAAPIQEMARQVIAKKRDNLGVQFKLAVQDHEWQQALRVGEQIIDEFPNSKMAEEVRDMMPVLRDRAAGAPIANATM